MHIRMLLNQALLLPILVVAVTLMTHSFNLWGYPTFEGDEGVYTTQAWWLVKFGRLAPYTYWYDHPPFGWLTIGLWQLATGGPFSFGFSLYSTRIFMVLVVTFTNLFIYLTVRRLTGSDKLALVASLFFALSPLGIFFHRRVLLDNLMTFWFILSLFFLWLKQKNLVTIWLSGLCFGLAFLSKETALVFLPVMVYGVFSQTPGRDDRFSRVVWLMTVFFLMSLFPLLALLKNELLPAWWLKEAEHVSLVETMIFQISRGDGIPPLSEGSLFRRSLDSWFSLDSLFIFLGSWASLIAQVLGRKNFRYKIVGLLVLSYWLFLARGGLVFDFYIIPLLPLLAICIAAGLSILGEYFPALSLLPKRRWFAWLGGMSLLVFAILMIKAGMNLYTTQATKSQVESVVYARDFLALESVVVVDAWAYLDLRLPERHGEKYFVNSQWFSKVVDDPAIRIKKLENDWRNIDYILLTHEMMHTMKGEKTPSLLQRAYNHTSLVADFPPVNPSTRNLANFESRSADWVTLLQVEAESPSLFSEVP